MAEPKKEIREKDPNYRKKAQWFGLACVVLLCITLILSVFMGGGRRRSDKKPLPIDQADAVHTGSQKDLQARIQQERIRRQKQLNEGRGLDSDTRMQELLERILTKNTKKLLMILTWLLTILFQLSSFHPEKSLINI